MHKQYIIETVKVSGHKRAQIVGVVIRDKCGLLLFAVKTKRRELEDLKRLSTNTAKVKLDI